MVFKISTAHVLAALGVLIFSGCQQMPSISQTATNAWLPEPSPQVVTDEKMCDDFLATMGQKPAGLEFVGCSAGFYEDNHSMIANYRVPGSDVYRVQEFLHRLSGMPRLVKDCCSWESIDASSGRHGGQIYYQGEVYYVRMQSSELRLGWNTAADAENIPSFDVQVIYPLNQYGFHSQL